MKINLNEIPQDGRNYSFSTQTGELNDSLSDLIEGMNFETAFSLVPIANTGTYQLNGFVKTTLNEACSRCGIDFKLTVDEKINYLLMPQTASSLPRDGFMQKANHFSDMIQEGPETTEYEGHHFNVGEFLHEVIAFAQPFNPAPELQQDGRCSTCGLKGDQIKCTFNEEMPVANKPFLGLKDIKLSQ
jgi:uncharacterized protein